MFKMSGRLINREIDILMPVRWPISRNTIINVPCFPTKTRCSSYGRFFLPQLNASAKSKSTYVLEMPWYTSLVWCRCFIMRNLSIIALWFSLYCTQLCQKFRIMTFVVFNQKLTTVPKKHSPTLLANSLYGTVTPLNTMFENHVSIYIYWSNIITINLIPLMFFYSCDDLGCCLHLSWHTKSRTHVLVRVAM